MKKVKKIEFRMKQTHILRFLIFVIVFMPFFSIISRINPGFAYEQCSYSPQNHLIPKSCTIFTVNLSNTVFFGNNEDYRLHGTYIWLSPSQEITTPSGNITTYGGIGFGFKYNDDPADGYIQGGMNDQGLCVDGNGLPVVSMNPHPERESPYTGVLRQILFECSDIDDVINWFLSHYLGSSWSGQIHFADATGDAVVVSVGIEGEFNFTLKKSSHYLVSTNFNLVNYANGYYPCSRFTTASTMLADITNEENLTVNACRDILDAVHVEGEYATKYSNIFDPVNLEIHLFYNHNFNEKVSLDLEEELTNVHRGGVNVLEENGYYYKEVSIVSLFRINPTISGFPIIIMISSIAVLSITFIFSKHKEIRIEK